MVDHPAAQVLDGPVIVLNSISSHVHILPQGSELKWMLLYYYYVSVDMMNCYQALFNTHRGLDYNPLNNLCAARCCEGTSIVVHASHVTENALIVIRGTVLDSRITLSVGFSYT